MADKIFVEGMIIKKPLPGAPDFVKRKISIEIEKFYAWAKEHQYNGWVNIDLLKSQKGTEYLALNTYKKAEAEEAKQLDL